MHHGSAIGVAIVAALMYHISYRGFICKKVDDAVNAAAVHGVCGLWGLIAAGFTVVDSAREDVGYPSADTCSRIEQSLANLIMAAFILLWVRIGERETTMQTQADTVYSMWSMRACFGQVFKMFSG